MTAKPQVDFLIGGVQKGGTTALFDYLHDVPDLSLAPVKEVHFFDNEAEVDWAAPDYGRYHRAFPEGPARARGEATPIYIYWPNCLERIQRYNPAMKLIFLFRDPAQRAWSQWKMEYARGFETEPFGWCIREGRRRVASDPDTPGFHRVFSYVERGFYGRQLARVFDLFAREQVLCLASNDLRRAPDETLRRVCHFLGVPGPDHALEGRELNVAQERNYGSTLTEADLEYLGTVYRDDLAAFQALSGLAL